MQTQTKIQRKFRNQSRKPFVVANRQEKVLIPSITGPQSTTALPNIEPITSFLSSPSVELQLKKIRRQWAAQAMLLFIVATVFSAIAMLIGWMANSTPILTFAIGYAAGQGVSYITSSLTLQS